MDAMNKKMTFDGRLMTLERKSFGVAARYVCGCTLTWMGVGATARTVASNRGFGMVPITLSRLAKLLGDPDFRSYDWNELLTNHI